MAKIFRHKAWVPGEDGTYCPVDSAGPADLPTWTACFRVHTAVLYMLRFEMGGIKDKEAHRTRWTRANFEHPGQVRNTGGEDWWTTGTGSSSSAKRKAIVKQTAGRVANRKDHCGRSLSDQD
eukprot:3220502-Amphidinium_carterae.1